MAQSLVHQPPLHIGTADEFARVRSALQAAGFDEETICRTLKFEEMCDVGSINLHQVDFSNVPEQFQLFVRLFFVLRLVPRAEVERLLDRETLSAFLSLGLLGTGEFGADEFYARVLLYPVAGFLMASDRHTNPDASPFSALAPQGPEDIFEEAEIDSMEAVIKSIRSTAVASEDVA